MHFFLGVKGPRFWLQAPYLCQGGSFTSVMQCYRCLSLSLFLSLCSYPLNFSLSFQTNKQKKTPQLCLTLQSILQSYFPKCLKILPSVDESKIFSNLRGSFHQYTIFFFLFTYLQSSEFLSTFLTVHVILHLRLPSAGSAAVP